MMKVTITECQSHTGVWEEISTKQASRKTAEAPRGDYGHCGLERKGQM